MSDLRKEIVEVYRSTDSIKATARELGISEQSIRHILLDAGVYTSERSQQIHKMWEAGLSAAEIAERLKIKEKTVLSYLPYSKTPYIFPEKSQNAVRIQKCRERKRKEQGKTGD